MADAALTTTALLLSTTTTFFTSTWTTPSTTLSILPTTSSTSVYSPSFTSRSSSSLFPFTSSTSITTTSSQRLREATVSTTLTKTFKRLPSSSMTTTSRSRSSRSDHESTTTKKRPTTTWSVWSSSSSDRSGSRSSSATTTPKFRATVKTSTRTTSPTTSSSSSTTTEAITTTSSSSSSSSTSSSTTTTAPAGPTCTQGQSGTSNTLLQDGGFEEADSKWTVESFRVDTSTSDPNRQTYTGCGALSIFPGGNGGGIGASMRQETTSPGGVITVSFYHGVPASVVARSADYAGSSVDISVYWGNTLYAVFPACTGINCPLQGQNGARFQYRSIQIPDPAGAGIRKSLRITVNYEGNGLNPPIIIDDIDAVAQSTVARTTSTSSSSTTTIVTTSSSSSFSTTSSSTTTTTTTAPASPTCTRRQTGTSNTLVRDGSFEDDQLGWTPYVFEGDVSISTHEPDRQTYDGCGALLIKPRGAGTMNVAIEQIVASPGGSITVSFYQGIPSWLEDSLFYSRQLLKMSVFWGEREYESFRLCTGSDCTVQGQNGARFQRISLQIPNDFPAGTRTPFQISVYAAGPGDKPAIIIDEVEITADPTITSTTTTSSSSPSTEAMTTTSSSSTTTTTSSSTTTTTPSGPTCTPGEGPPDYYIKDGGFEFNQWSTSSSGFAVNRGDEYKQTYQGCHAMSAFPIDNTFVGAYLLIYQDVLLDPQGVFGVEFLQGVRSQAFHVDADYTTSTLRLEVLIDERVVWTGQGCVGEDCPIAGQNGARFQRHLASFRNDDIREHRLTIAATFEGGRPFAFMLDDVRMLTR